jgi:preprotein translocase subunit SecA
MIRAMQKKVEGLNFDIRKNLTDYDVVLSNQREVVYKQRDQILKNERNIPIIRNMVNIVAADLVALFTSKLNTNFVDSNALVKAINTKVFGFDVIEESLFEKATIPAAKAILTRVI